MTTTAGPTSTLPGRVMTDQTLDVMRASIATFDRYADAERAVDQLADLEFPVQRTAIVGTGLRYVEQISGRLTVRRAAVGGAAQGAMFGLLFGVLFGLLFTVGETFFVLLGYWLITSAAFGAVLAALSHRALGGRRDFASVAGVGAAQYELQVDAALADRARTLLGLA